MRRAARTCAAVAAALTMVFVGAGCGGGETVSVEELGPRLALRLHGVTGASAEVGRVVSLEGLTTPPSKLRVRVED